ncbi:oligosaccharyl transferase, archaeosortase A system-associated [Natrononativus amylolyticus]|uniref:oligosaccharyl transferase, archaeosortase A system-associated n=1 Tax=Natrononativus amylolyticus TaxID=2963434 RepID=UPI0020CEEB4C|nr:oligosaccharyl transferase, archaeosortase A system-associated [Natrononativus amylolyticus]
MSTDTEHVDEAAETSVLDTWEEWYHIPIIGIVMLFMIWVRTQSYDRFVTDDGTPALAAVDSWYHWRTVQWTAENYPWTMPFDVWTGFPTGRYVGQFGTLFDQLIVTAAMVVGLGDPSTETLYTVSLLAVPVMAALVAIPVFYMGRRLGGTIGGLLSVVLLALAPGTFLYRTTAGQLQHHVAEVLFMALAVLAMMVALRVAEREKPIYELVVDGDWAALRTPAIYSALAGVALSLYIWVWPPGVVLIGIFAVFFTVQLCLDYVRGISPDHVAFVGAVSLGVTAIVTALLIEEWSTSTTSFGYLQPISAALVAAGCLFMAWLARQWNRRSIDPIYYPAAIGGLLFVAFGAMALALPDLFGTLSDNLVRRLIPIGATETDMTISEAQPPEDFNSHVFSEFGMAFYTMLAGLALLALGPLLGRTYRAEHTLILVWSLFLISMAATQVRFAYYLVLAVAVVNAVFVSDVIRLFNLDLEGGVRSIREIETYQVITLLLVVMLLFAPLLPPVAAGTAWDRGAAAFPSDDGQTWEESNHWLQENTPAPGDWGGADNASDLEYYGTYDYPEDGNYEYPVGAYGVMSWWDYGHLITVQGERIPHSNPFQQNARSSSAFLTAQSEERGELIMDGIAADVSVSNASDEEIERQLEGNDSHEELRYVMIDHKMAGGKFGAISTWTGPGYGAYLEQNQYQINGEEETLHGPGEAYYDTMLASLYLEDADGLEHYRLVHEADDYAVVGGMLGNDGPVPRNSFALDDGWNENTEQIRDNLAQSREDGAVDQSLGGAIWDGHLASSVKTFERVEGATLTGTVDDSALDEEATVYAEIELETAPGRTFTYTQEADVEDGAFELTVPYATNDELGTDDGYTDSSVEALEEYEIVIATGDGDDLERQYAGTASVPETAVVDGDSIDVTLEEATD